MIDSKWLKGLVWSGAHDRGVKDVDGRKLRVYEAFTRPLESKDVVSFKETVEEVICVSSDGKKHFIKKPSISLKMESKVEGLKI